jgi:hypothetical protein
LRYKPDTPIDIGTEVIFLPPAEEKPCCMDRQIGGRIGRQLPEITAYRNGNKTIVRNPLTRKLGVKFLGITDRKNNATPSRILGETE